MTIYSLSTPENFHHALFQLTIYSLESINTTLVSQHRLTFEFDIYGTIYINFQNFMWSAHVVKFAVHLLSPVQLFATPSTAARQATPFSTISQNLLQFMSTVLVTLSNHLVLPFRLLPSIFPSIRVFYNESDLLQWVSSSHQVAEVL